MKEFLSILINTPGGLVRKLEYLTFNAMNESGLIPFYREIITRL